MDNNNYNYNPYNGMNNNQGTKQQFYQQSNSVNQPNNSTEYKQTETVNYQQNTNSSYQQNNAAYNTAYNVPQNITKPVKKDKKSGFGVTIAKAVAVALVFGLVSGTVFTGINVVGNKIAGIKTEATSDKKTGSSNKNSGSIAKTGTGNAADLTDVSSIVDEVMPSVVAITNTGTVTYQSYFGRSYSQESQSCGSGFIYKQDDDYIYIATNNHVVSGAEKLTVQFADDAVVDANTQGTVPSNDLAIVKVAIADIPKDTYNAIKVASIGNSDELSVGEASIAIGNALGFGQSVTTGVISALGRTVSSQDETTGETVTNNNLIQTDAAINPGNSGGALLNSKGEVIGINSVKYASTEVEGIGYAIPMSEAQPILDSLIKTGTYTNTQNAYLGIEGRDVSSDMAGYNIPYGVYVQSVIDGSGADKAGIQEGDVITKFDGKTISSLSELQSLLSGYDSGDKVKITVSRQRGQGYEEQEIEVKLGSR